MTGARLRERILERWGSRDRLRDEARAGDPDAREDLFTLERLEEDPQRLEAEHERTTVTELEADRLARLTEKRLELLDWIATHPTGLNVSELADLAGRDKKNVSRGLELLEEVGFVERIPSGREKQVHLRGSRISIDVTPSEGALA
jgi:predicted transcriptional regulator